MSEELSAAAQVLPDTHESRADRVRVMFWVPISVGLPTPMQTVLACNANRQHFYGEVTYRAGQFLDRTGHVFPVDDATHWMLYPRLPKPYRAVRRHI